MARRRVGVAALLALLLLLVAAPALAGGAGDGGPDGTDGAGTNRGEDSEVSRGRGQGRDGNGPPGQARDDDADADDDTTAPSPDERDGDERRERDRNQGPEVDHTSRVTDEGDATSSPRPDPADRGGTATTPGSASSADSRETRSVGTATSTHSSQSSQGGDGTPATSATPDDEALPDEEPSDETASESQPSIRLETRADVARDAEGRKVVDRGEVASVTFHYTLRNTGDEPVTVVHLSDEAVPALSVEALSATALAPGERAHATASVDLREAPIGGRQLSTAALATAVTGDGTRVSDAASETLRLVGTTTTGEDRDDAALATEAGTTTPHAGSHASDSTGTSIQVMAAALVLLLTAVPLARRARWARRELAWPPGDVRGSHAPR
jgi:hypothetical protein